MKIIICCLSFLVASYTFAGQPYCLKDFLSGGVAKCVDFSTFASGSLCLKDNSAAVQPANGWTEALLESTKGADQCVSISAAATNVYAATFLTYRETKPTSGGATLDAASATAETGVTKQTGNRICGDNETCDVGGAPNLLCRPDGTVYGRAICVNRTSCSKDDKSYAAVAATDAKADSFCQFLDPCRTATGGLVSPQSVAAGEQYCYQGELFIVGDPGRACDFSGASSTCKNGGTCSGNGTCPGCTLDTHCSGIGTGHCDTTQGTCDGCLGNQHCPGVASGTSRVCSQQNTGTVGTCHACTGVVASGSSTGTICPVNYTCTNGDCVAPAPPPAASAPALLANNSACTLKSECASNFCSNTVCAGCNMDADCSGTEYCTGSNVCAARLSNGSQCSDNAQCASNVCSNSSCT